MNSALEKRFEEIEQIALSLGLDPFPIIFEEVPREIIWEVASYGLPTRMSHWSFGRSFIHQKLYGEMGYSKIYELILNNNPSYAFLDETNSDISNLLICAHCQSHSDFFKNNITFAKTDRNMVNQAEANAKTIDAFKERYGIDEVEDWMDVAFSIEGHIDPNRGEHRQKYPPPEHVFTFKHPLPYADLFGETDQPQVVDEIKNLGFPPFKERDILWFLANYSKMMPWQREIFDMVRAESFYFYPQGQTKTINEGWASFWHAEILLNYWNLSAAEHLEFSQIHSNVVRPAGGGKINPYYLGFRIFGDIKRRWDEYYAEGKKDRAFMESDMPEMLDENGKIVMSKIDGFKKILRVRAEDDDISFIQNYLTLELCQEMKLFTYGMRDNNGDWDEEDIILKSRDVEKIKNGLTGRMHNNGVPPIFVKKADENGLWLAHDLADPLPLDPLYAKATLEYIYKAWKKPVYLTTTDGKGSIVKYEAGKHGVTEEVRAGDGYNSIKFSI